MPTACHDRIERSAPSLRNTGARPSEGGGGKDGLKKKKEKKKKKKDTYRHDIAGGVVSLEGDDDPRVDLVDRRNLAELFQDRASGKSVGVSTTAFGDKERAIGACLLDTAGTVAEQDALAGKALVHIGGVLGRGQSTTRVSTRARRNSSEAEGWPTYGEGHESERHIVAIAADLDEDGSVLGEFHRDGRLESNVLLALGKIGDEERATRILGLRVESLFGLAVRDAGVRPAVGRRLRSAENARAVVRSRRDTGSVARGTAWAGSVDHNTEQWTAPERVGGWRGMALDDQAGRESKKPGNLPAARVILDSQFGNGTLGAADRVSHVTGLGRTGFVVVAVLGSVTGTGRRSGRQASSSSGRGGWNHIVSCA